MKRGIWFAHKLIKCDVYIQPKTGFNVNKQH